MTSKGYPRINKYFFGLAPKYIKDLIRREFIAPYAGYLYTVIKRDKEIRNIHITRIKI